MPPKMQPHNLAKTSQSMTVKRGYNELEALNGSIVKLAVNENLYPWHSHPNSDEMFLIVEGELNIEFKDRDTVSLGEGDLFKIPAGVIHQTRPKRRTVNLLFEAANAITRFEDKKRG